MTERTLQRRRRRRIEGSGRRSAGVTARDDGSVGQPGPAAGRVVARTTRTYNGAMSQPLAFWNGEFVPASALAVSPTDAGFVLGVTVAEQLRTFAGRIFRLPEHLARLERSLQEVGIDPGLTREDWSRVAVELVARNHALLEPGDDLGLTIFVTPGPYPAYPQSGPATPTVAMHTYPLPFGRWANQYERGQALATTGVPQVPVSCWPRALKCRSRMHYYLADRRAAERDPGARALITDSDGSVCEASTANVVIVRPSEGLLTPPSPKVLPGISLAMVRERAAALGLGFQERELTVEDVASAEEVILTSTPTCLLPVTRFNRRPIGGGKPGPVFRRLLADWSHQVGVDIAGQARRFASRKQATGRTALETRQIG